MTAQKAQAVPEVIVGRLRKDAPHHRVHGKLARWRKFEERTKLSTAAHQGEGLEAADGPRGLGGSGGGRLKYSGAPTAGFLLVSGRS